MSFTLFQNHLVNENLISESKKELENFIEAKFEDRNPGRTFQKALENFSTGWKSRHSCIRFFETADSTSNDMLLTVSIFQL